MSSHAHVRRRGPAPAVLLLLVVAALVAAGIGALRAGPAPQITITPGLPAIGKHTPLTIAASEPKRGLVRLRVEAVQGETRAPLAEKSYAPRPSWAFWGPRTASDELRLTVGRDNVPGLREGEARIVVTADRAGAWLRHPPPVVTEVALPVRLVPPTLQVTSTQTYVAQGGCEAVVYRVGSTAKRDGVAVGERCFPGYPLPGGGPQDRFAFFAVPYDTTDASQVRLVAADEVDNEATATFVDKFFPKPFKKDAVQVEDKFLNKVVPEILSHTPELAASGDVFQDWLKINGELRRKNSAELVELGGKTQAQFLWRQPFVPFPNSQVMAHFADHRTYFHAGREVDQQFHLGFDLASTQHAPVPANNRGVVVLARYFGIFGNAVIVDHGYGLQSLYAHLSSIAVQPGQAVERGAVLGQSGETGLAGGDHLHFSFLLAGLPVNPVEWWDPHWIQDRLARKLGAAMPFAATP